LKHDKKQKGKKKKRKGKLKNEFPAVKYPLALTGHSPTALLRSGLAKERSDLLSLMGFVRSLS